MEGSRIYRWHVENYGHPSEFGFKDVINLWKADKWNPEELMELYHRAGARYFFSLGNHHDNFDNWNSRHHKWNAVNMGPEKDIVGGWEKVARKYGMYFGVSIHSAHALIKHGKQQLRDCFYQSARALNLPDWHHVSVYQSEYRPAIRLQGIVFSAYFSLG